MAKTRDVSEIQLHKDPWRPANPRKVRHAVSGFDTETDKGYAFLMTSSTEWAGERPHPMRSFQDFVQSVWNKRTLASINFFYNLDFDFAAIVKHLGRDHLTDLAAANQTVWAPNGKARPHFTIKWIPAKAFQVTKQLSDGRAAGTVRFYDAAQYYRASLARAAGKVGEEKYVFDTGAVDKAQYDKDPAPRAPLVMQALRSREDYDKLEPELTYKERLLAYGMQDSRICRKLGRRLYDAVNKVVPVGQFYSTATIAQAMFLARIKCRVNVPPKAVLSAALQAYGGGRFELIRRGHFDDCWEADINSAYPQEFTGLVATRSETGSWGRVREGAEPDADAHYGFYQVDVDTGGHVLSPVMHREKDRIYYPHGHHRGAWMERSELELCEEMGWRPRVLDGYEYHDPDPVLAFGFVEDIYRQRKQYEKDGAEDLAYVYKIGMNSAYGKTIQLTPDLDVVEEIPVGFDQSLIHREIERPDGKVTLVIRKGWKAGKMFNPVFAAAITARVRTRLLRTVVRYGLEERIIGFATDCIFLKGKPPAEIMGEGLGAWGLEAGPTEALFVGSGVYALREKDHVPHGELEPGEMCRACINKMRGFDVSNELFEAARKNHMEFVSEAPIKLRQGVRGATTTVDGEEVAYDWRDIGVFMPVAKTVNPNFDRKRRWNREVKDFRELLDGEIGSMPLTVGEEA